MKHKKIFFYITDAGGGHRGSAESLKTAIEARRLPWDVRIVNVYREIWRDIEPGLKYLNFGGEDLYNLLLKHDLQILINLLKKMTPLTARLYRGPGAAAAEALLLKEKPDLGVSLMPFINDALAAAHEQAGVPLGFVLTDLVDTPPMWLTPGICRTAKFVATGCEEAAQQALQARVDGRLLRGALIIHPKHFEPKARTLNQAAARKRFGLDKKLFTALVVMGGYGGRVIEEFARRFDKSKDRWQLVACCGRNEKLKLSLDRLAKGLKNRLVPMGFTKELHLLMRAADVVVTKPGPATIMEALAMGTPMVLDGAGTMEQEIPNIRFVTQGGFGLACHDRKRILEAVEGLKQNPGMLKEMRGRIRAYHLRDASGPIIKAMGRELGSKSRL